MTSLFSSSSCRRLSYLMLLVLLYSFFCTCFVSCKCLEHQKSLLVDFKKNLKVDPFSDKLVGWNQSTDCCQWSGVECDNSNGRVIGLDLSNGGIDGGIDNSSSLFRLQFLQRLNLANNDWRGEMPPAFGKLTSLTYLNLSIISLSGQVPIEISQLVNLVVLDMSHSYELYMKKPNLATIIQNMTNLKELYLDDVNNSAMGNKWCETLSSSVPQLQVLSMSGCDLRGEIHKSLSNLKNLSEITLDNNRNLTGPVPEFLADYANLTKLSLFNTAITGTVPEKIFQIPTLRILELSSDSNLQGTLPEFPKNGSLEVLSLSNTNFSSTLKSSIANLKRLHTLDLSSCHFHGSIPPSIGSLERLEKLYLSSNQFQGPIPSSIGSLERLEKLRLSNNQFEGPIPSSIGSLERLEELDLSDNQFEGPIPKSLFHLKELKALDLSSNRFNETLQLSKFLGSFKQLLSLDLSKNSWSINIDGCGVNSSFPQLQSLELASCNLQSTPKFLKNQTQLLNLDLSMNQITGTIPGWMWSMSYLENLNLEYNNLSGTIPDCLFAMPELFGLNLGGNSLGGDIPDKFTKGCALRTLQLNDNSLQGQIPASLAHCKSLEVLDVGHNQLYDTFPCHIKSLSHLQVLILRSNKFHGTMLCIKGHSIWPLLQVVDLASNNFSGELSAYLSLKWKSMMAQTNAVQPKQPEYLENMYLMGYYKISVTIASKGSSNKQYILTVFSCIDLSNNAFYGKLPTQLGNLNALKVLNLSHNFLSGHIPPSLGNLSQIESLDLSCNTFNGKIPPQLANLNFLEYFNLSYNKLSGKIPTGTQLQTFNASSYEGNKGLYGPPLTWDRRDPTGTTPSSSTGGSSWSSKDQIGWMLRGAGVGFPVGVMIFLGPLLYIKRYRDWYCEHLHRLVMKMFRKEDSPGGRRARNRQLTKRR